MLGLSFALSTIGLVLLFMVSEAQGPVPISSLTPDDMGSGVYVKGTVHGLRRSADGHLFFVLEDGEGRINVAIFKGVAHDVSCVEEGREIALRGVVDEYRGELEVVPRRAGDVEC